MKKLEILLDVQIFKNKVREFRELNTWSISELARQAGVVPQTVSKMEKGIATSRNSKLKVAKALGKNFEEVFPFDARG